MGARRSIKSILLLSLIVTFGILVGFAVFAVWWEFASFAFLISTVLFLVGLGCVYIVYRGFKQGRIVFSLAEVLIVVLVVGSVFMYSSVNDLRNRVAALERPQLSEIYWKYDWSVFYDSGQSYGNDTVSGVVFNSGIRGVNVTVVFRVYGGDNNLVYSKELPLGQIAGKSYVSFETELIYSTRGLGSGHGVSHSFVLT